MQNSDKYIILFNNESQLLIEKYQKNVIYLQESIKKLKRENLVINKNLGNEKQGQNNLQKLSGWLNSKIKNYQLERNCITIRNQNKKLAHLNNKIIFILSQRQKGLELFKGQWLMPAEIQARKEAEVGIGDNFKSMSNDDFEYFIAALFSEMGYETKVVPLPDYGVDVIAKKSGRVYAIQCKKFNERNPVSNKYIQQLLGALDYYKAQEAIFVTTSSYTKNAIKQTKNSQIELWDKIILHEHIEKFLLKKESKEIISLIEREKLKLTEKERAEERKLMEKRRIEQDKTICPRCLGGKRKSHKLCSRCKQEIMRINKRERGGRGTPNFREPDIREPDFSGSSFYRNPFDR